MKRKLKAIAHAVMLVCLAFHCGASIAIVEWDANPETNIGGYRVYTGHASRAYDRVVDVGNVTLFTNDYSLGQHFIAVTAYDTDGLESDFSQELSLLIVAPPAPRFESNTLTWAGTGTWRVSWASDAGTNCQIVSTNRLPLAMFAAGSRVAVRRYELGSTNVLSDYSVTLFYNPPQVARSVRIRVFLQKTRDLNEPFADFAEAPFFDEARDQSFYRARLEISQTGPRLR